MVWRSWNYLHEQVKWVSACEEGIVNVSHTETTEIFFHLPGDGSGSLVVKDLHYQWTAWENLLCGSRSSIQESKIKH